VTQQTTPTAPKASAPLRTRGKSDKSIHLILAARIILEEIHPSSVRGVCYQLFNRKLIADMSKNSTNRVSRQLLWAREQGIIPWKWIVDETRAPEGHPGWDDPEAFADYAQSVYRRDLWAEQQRLVMVVSEKGTVRGIVKPITDAYHVQFLPMHGYGSATAAHDLAELSLHLPEHTKLHILYVGDYDPSGMQMFEDLTQRVSERYGGSAEVARIALTREDVESGKLPSFPVASKLKDPRFKWWHRQGYGDSCWELDALSPVVLRQRVDRHLSDLVRDQAAWHRAARVQEVERESMVGFLNTWAALFA